MTRSSTPRLARRLLLGLLAVLLAAIHAPLAAAAAPHCPPGQPPRFALGFRALADTLGPTMGAPLECEHANPANGDALQQTSTGLAFYRQRTNTPTFTNGWEHWALTAEGLVSWTGDSVDPPGLAVPTVAAAVARPSLYLALGDSLALGVGATDPELTGYVGRLFEQLRAELPGLGRLANLGLYGETSATFAGGQLERAVAAIADPTSEVTLVTLDLGSNDLLYLMTTPACLFAPTGAVCQQPVAAALDAFADRYAAILGRLTRALAADGGRGRLLVMTTYNPFAGTGLIHELVADGVLLGSDGTVDCAANTADPARRGLNDAIACAAGRYGATVVDVYPRFWGSALALTHIGVGDVHPTDAGYAAIANAFAEAVAAGSRGR